MRALNSVSTRLWPRRPACRTGRQSRYPSALWGGLKVGERCTDGAAGRDPGRPAGSGQNKSWGSRRSKGPKTQLNERAWPVLMTFSFIFFMLKSGQREVEAVTGRYDAALW